jgi:SAM-dependent methyltransferase
MNVDFSATAQDYVLHRLGFPDELFRRLAGFGVGEVGQRIVDLGAGTGYLGRGFAKRGARVLGVDLSEALVAEAKKLDAAAGLPSAYVIAPAEATGLPDASAEIVSAGQCWHWFDRPAAAAEAFRLLAPGGRLAIVHFDWLPLPGNVVEATEELIAEHNPHQPAPHRRHGGGHGIYPEWLLDARLAGFTNLETFSFDAELRYSHEGWRGRIRASQGVGAMLDLEAVSAFDEDLAGLLAERFAEQPLVIPHRAFAVVGEKPRTRA